MNEGVSETIIKVTCIVALIIPPVACEMHKNHLEYASRKNECALDVIHHLNYLDLPALSKQCRAAREKEE